MKFKWSSVINAIALAIMFPFSLVTLLSIKFWIVMGLMSLASMVAEGQGIVDFQRRRGERS